MNFIQQFGARLITNGYSIIPIMPGTKKPGAYLAGEWRDYREWSRHCSRPTGGFEFNIWKTWPDAGIGIACGRVVGIDIDIKADPTAALTIEKLARDMLGDTPAMRIGLAPKRMLVYRTAKPFEGFKRHPLEVIGHGQQFVAYALHPDTGKPYAWPDEALADLDYEALPEVTEEMCRQWIDEAYRLVPEELRPKTVLGVAGDPRDHAPNLSLRGTHAAVEEALAYVPNADFDYDSWVKIGHAIKGALGEAGEDVWLRWSAMSQKDDPDATLRAWKSFRPNKIGAGTIYHLAFEQGWAPRPGLILNAVFDVPETEEHPAKEMIERLRAQVEAAAAAATPEPAADQPAESAGEGRAEEPAGWSFQGDEFDDIKEFHQPKLESSAAIPADVYQVGGVVQQLAEFIVATAIRPQPFLALGAAIACVAVLMGRKYQTPTRLRSNVYVVGMAASGGGKDHPRKVVAAVLQAAGFRPYIGGNKIASGSALLTALQRSPASIFQLDEFGQFMKLALDKKKAPKHVEEIWHNLTELYTSASSTFFGTEYADQKVNKRVDIVQPCCVLHASTVPGPFWEALQSGAMSDGSLARFLLFETDNDIPDMNRRPASLDRIPVPLLEGLKAIEAGVPGHTGNLTMAGAEAVEPKPYIVPCDAAAQGALDALDDELTLRMREAERRKTGETAIYARVGEQVRKLALIRAVSRDSGEPAIRAEDVTWARGLVEHCTGKLLADARSNIADNDVERELKKVLRIIEAAGSEGMSQSELTLRTRFLTGRRRQEILNDLLESGEVVEQIVATKTKPIRRYRGK